MLRKLRFISRCYPYASHMRAYHQLLVLCAPHVVTQNSPEQAEVMLFYGTPILVEQYRSHISNFESLYRIGHFVWEADSLSPVQLQALMLCHEVWTPSYYCWRILSSYHPRVFWVPHVVTPPTAPPTGDDCERLRKIVPPDPNVVTFISIGTDDLRKNYATLAQAFSRLHAEFPKTRLVLKHNPIDGKQGIFTDGPILRMYEHVSQDFIEALYGLADVYVSAHHSEGWGFTLSDAMVRRVLTVAPAYGGNLEFMAPTNSILLPASEGPIGPDATDGWFSPEMKWGHVSVDELVRGMKVALNITLERGSALILNQAYEDVIRFDHRFAAGIVHGLLQNVLEALPKRP